jgi:inhibitor-of-growth protein 1
VQSGSVAGNGSSNGNGGNVGNDRGNKRPRRSRTDTSTECSNAGEVNNPGNGEAARVGSQTRKQSSNGGKKKKRKARQQQMEDNPPALLVNNALREELQHDVDEPTYCLCDQISYGEMILCDNDLCPIEWFHFVCVSLTSKPKGKWFCPKCRGDRANVMKPKSQFLKELERYNKEKEEKS